MSKPIYDLYPGRPPYCPMDSCECIIHSFNGDEPYEPGRSILCMSEAQKLIDGLYRCELKLTEGIGSIGQLSATEKHLEDMRSIVESQLKLKLPENKKPVY